ncbi:hypothetical protein PAXINDRAFT_9314 [Paxillus involutus ATCC 200175]|nr:hypothetical protein PAXINDRAFT_9314 [Paxillus involutus ATCC 200175]
MHWLAAVCIAEESSITTYHQKLLLYDLEGGSAQMQHEIEHTTKPYRLDDANARMALCQTKLITKLTQKAAQKPGAKIRVRFTWPDGLYHSDSDVTCGEFNLPTELRHAQQIELLPLQERELQKIANVVEGARISWQDVTGSANPKERPTIERSIEAKFAELVKNFYVYTVASNPSERLRVMLHSPVGETGGQQMEFIAVFASAHKATLPNGEEAAVPEDVIMGNSDVSRIETPNEDDEDNNEDNEDHDANEGVQGRKLSNNQHDKEAPMQPDDAEMDTNSETVPVTTVTSLTTSMVIVRVEMLNLVPESSNEQEIQADIPSTLRAPSPALELVPTQPLDPVPVRRRPPRPHTFMFS